MRRLTITMMLAATMLFAGCYEEEVSYFEERINELEEGIDELEDNEIASIEKQIATINGSIDDLKGVDAELDGYIDALQNTAADLQSQIDATNTALAALESDLEGQITASEQKVLNELTAVKTALEGQFATINNTIQALQTKDAELDQKIADLKNYVDSEITATEDWATATFSTLEQYEATQTAISEINALINSTQDSIAALEEKLNKKIVDDIATAVAGVNADIAAKVTEITDGYTAAIADVTDAITEAYTDAIKTAITASETSMKEWVNGVLAEGYYTKAEIDGKITAFQTQVSEGEAALQKEIDNLKAALEKAESDLTAAYEKAITDAVADGGIINAAIAAAVKTAQDTLQARIDAINGEISDIENRLEELENNFANRIQSLTYIPTHTDGKATMAYNTTSGKWEAELSFFVTPKSVVGNIKQEHLSAKGVYTAATRAVNLINLSVTAFESDATKGTITVTVSGENLSQDFFNGNTDAAVFLIISDGNSEFVSDYVPLTIEQTYTYDQASNTYTVYTAKGLYAWNEALQTDLNTNLVLAADITLPNKDFATGEEITVTDGKPSGSNWNPYGYYDSNEYTYTMYNGTIDGGGHTISGMRINMDDKSGFVNVLGGSGSIRNLLIDDVVIYSTGFYAAAFAGTNYGIIENCHVKGEASSIYGQAFYVGGIVGDMNNNSGDAKIIACSNMATVTPANLKDSACGGIVGSIYDMSSNNLNVIGCWTKDTNENDREKDGIGRNGGAFISGVFSVADATAANSKIPEMNKALEDAGYSYRWETKSGDWPEIKKYGE